MEARDGERLETFTHTFTHFKLHITPLRIQLVRKPLRVEQAGSVWLDVGEALGAAIPTPVRAMLSGFDPLSLRERVRVREHLLHSLFL